MPGNSVSSFAAMTCSSSTKRCAVGEREEAGEQRRHLDPGEALLAGRRVAHGDREVQRQVRDVGERVRGVDGERREHREDVLGEQVVEVGAVVVGQIVPVGEADAALVERGHELLGEHRRPARSHELVRPASRIARSWSTRSRPSGVVVRSPAASCSISPATRTWKNSSRFSLKMARNFARSSSGTARGPRRAASTRASKSSNESSRLR